ncbi:Uncharacterised protein [Mycobacteroides abscessus subsp. abscessus]|nr:Uncharacterised protein [Mycobacteroides abscessus subsp. abscessus]
MASTVFREASEYNQVRNWDRKAKDGSPFHAAMNVSWTMSSYSARSGYVRATNLNSAGPCRTTRTSNASESPC